MTSPTAPHTTEEASGLPPRPIRQRRPQVSHRAPYDRGGLTSPTAPHTTEEASRLPPRPIRQRKPHVPTIRQRRSHVSHRAPYDRGGLTSPTAPHTTEEASRLPPRPYDRGGLTSPTAPHTIEEVSRLPPRPIRQRRSQLFTVSGARQTVSTGCPVNRRPGSVHPTGDRFAAGITVSLTNFVQQLP